MAVSQSVLVTGGAGYVGSVLVDELLVRGHSVRVLDVLLHGKTSSLLRAWTHPRFEFVRGDVRDVDVLRQCLVDIDAAVHLAAIVGDPACSRQPELAKEVNLDGTRSLLAEAERAGVGRLVFASTCSNYGKLADSGQYAVEAGELRPISLYAETKVAAEDEVLARSANGITTCCLRLATVYGTSPRMRFDLTVNEFTREVALWRELVVYGEQFWRPYIHVGDAARALCLALEASVDDVSGQVFNAGSTPENYRKLDLVELLRERVPTADIRFVDVDEDPRDYRVSFDKIVDRLGFSPDFTVPTGIDEVMALVRSGLVDPDAPLYRN
jgi:nucleoside-diphosphate-sugar epimerase